MDINYIQYLIIGAYFVFLIAKGLSHTRKIKDKEDFLIAGRNANWFFLFCTMSATIVGGGYTMGAIASTYEFGIAWVIVSIGGYLQFIFAGKYVAPEFRKAKVYTVAAYFRHRYDEKSGMASFILSLVFSVGVLGAQLVAFGEIISIMLPGIDFTTAALIGAGIVILYSSFGGLMAVIHTDVYQFSILTIGIIITAAISLGDIGQVWAENAAKIPEEFFKVESNFGFIYLASTFMAFLLGETFAPGYATRFGAAKNIDITKKGIIRAGIFLTLTFPILIFVISLFARLHFPEIDPQKVLPRTVLMLNNPYLGALIIGALLSAVMSSSDSILNSAAAIVVKDYIEIYKKHWLDSPKKGLRIARAITVGLGVLGILLAIAMPNIIDILLLTYSFWAPGIIIPVVIGVFYKKRSGQLNMTIFLTMITGIVVTIIFKNINFEINDKPAQEVIQPLLVGVSASLAAFFAQLIYYRAKNINILK